MDSEKPKFSKSEIMKSTVVLQDTSSQKSLESDRRSVKSEEQILAHFGKRQQLRRNFSLVSCLGLGCTLSMWRLQHGDEDAAC